ncbi:MAG: MGDG synthase family glycosyltransferase [Trueperaceae bacterium]
MSKARILLAMITVGNGHKAPADALKAGIEKLYPAQFEIDVLDFTLAVGDKDFDKRHKESWDWMLENPKFAYWGQRLLDKAVPVPATRFVQAQMLNDHAKNAAAFIKDKNYDFVVATHFFTVQALAIAKNKHGLKVLVIGLNTDPFDAHAMWAEKDVDEMIVSSRLAKKKLMEKGVPGKKIKIFGYPLGLQFMNNTLSKTDSRVKLDLELGKLTILQSAGGEGIGGQLEDFVKAVLEADLDVQYIIACGRNQELHSHLQKLASEHRGKTTLLPQGFITNMQEWIAASDLIVGKAGAATTFEALVMNRPIFHTNYIAYNEKTNIDFCIQKGIGKYIPEPRQLVEVLEPLTKDKTPLEILSNKIAALNIQPGTLDIAKHLIQTYLSPAPLLPRSPADLHVA